MIAAELGNVERMRSLVSATKQYNMTDEWMTQADRKGRTPLHLAAIWGYREVVAFIVDEIIGAVEDEWQRKKYLNLKDYKGRTPLFHAIAEERNSVARVLIENGADMEEGTDKNHIEPGSTPLMACAEKNNREAFEHMLKSGANILTTRNDSADALYIAARYGHVHLIEYLAESKKLELVLNRPSYRGRTALSTAAAHGHFQTCKLLFLNGAILDHQDDNKLTALMYAANLGHIEIVKWLVVTGAKANLRDDKRQTAYKYAENNGYEEIAKYLKLYTYKETATHDAPAAKPGSNAKSVPKKAKDEKISNIQKKDSVKKSVSR